MKSKDWKNFAELVGITAIVASLIFVGLQLKQSQEIAVASQYQDRADAALSFYLARMQSDPALAMLAKDISDDAFFGHASIPIENALESEGAEMVAIRYLFYRSNITMFDNYHFQYENGFLTEDAWQAFHVRLRGVLSNDISAAFYREEANDFRQSFRNVCLRILEEIEATSKS